MEQQTEINKNEIVARFMANDAINSPHLKSPDLLHYDESYDWLMSSWIKFRDLQFENDWKQAEAHVWMCVPIGSAILNKSITEAFDELVKGIEWYESLNK